MYEQLISYHELIVSFYKAKETVLSFLSFSIVLFKRISLRSFCRAYHEFCKKGLCQIVALEYKQNKVYYRILKEKLPQKEVSWGDLHSY